MRLWDLDFREHLVIVAPTSWSKLLPSGSGWGRCKLSPVDVSGQVIDLDARECPKFNIMYIMRIKRLARLVRN